MRLLGGYLALTAVLLGIQSSNDAWQALLCPDIRGILKFVGGIDHVMRLMNTESKCLIAR